MNARLANYQGQEFNVELYFSQEFKGRGAWNILCEVTFQKNKKTFTFYTTDSQFIDQISDMKADNASFDDIQNSYNEKAFDSMEERIIEWCEGVLESNEQE